MSMSPMTPHPSARQEAERIFTRINESYMVFNKGAQHGINHNTELIIKQEIEAALHAAEQRGRAEERVFIEKEVKLLASYFEGTREVVLHVNDVRPLLERFKDTALRGEGT